MPKINIVNILIAYIFFPLKNFFSHGYGQIDRRRPDVRSKWSVSPCLPISPALLFSMYKVRALLSLNIHDYTTSTTYWLLKPIQNFILFVEICSAQSGYIFISRLELSTLMTKMGLIQNRLILIGHVFNFNIMVNKTILQEGVTKLLQKMICLIIS